MEDDKRFEEIYNKENSEKGAIHNMCDVIDRYIEKGIEEGKKQGIKKGIEQATLESIHNIMNTLDLSLQQAMDALLIPEADQQKYRNLTC